VSENMAENRLNDGFDSQKYSYYPEDKNMLSFDEIMYGISLSPIALPIIELIRN